jgi:sugar/nucleoside kinase (ribokinase family)
LVAKKKCCGQDVRMKNLLLTFLLFTSTAYAHDYQVLGLGSPLVDYVITVTEEELSHLQVAKGGWREIEAALLKEFLVKYPDAHVFTGDCTSNTIKGLAALGISCALTGKVGNDALGEHVRTVFNDLKVTILFSDTEKPTDRLACLVTPDGDRSFCGSFLARNSIHENELSQDYFKEVKLVHMEGYRLANGAYMEKAMIMAKESGAKISLDLADAGIVKKYRERILALVEGYTDILFVNEDEAFALTQLPPEKSALFLKNLCPLVVIKIADKGCWVCSEAGLFHSPGFPAHVVDTTGAGDVFASAFLYAYLNGYPLRACAEFGNRAGSAVVERYGAELSLAKWEEIKQALPNKRS